jgi:GAF domain-containing protein
MEVPRTASEARRASGLLEVDTLRDPDRLAVVRSLLEAAAVSPVVRGLVDLAADVAACSGAQVSLLADQQVAVAMRCPPDSPDRFELQDGLCAVTVLSGDVLVAADTRAHPWLRDLAPVTLGVVGAYLGAPLVLTDGTVVGALCVWETSPRTWSDREVGLVCGVADVVALELSRLSAG